MARCVHCGKWAGFFKDRHQGCEEGSTRLSLRVATPQVETKPDAEYLKQSAPPIPVEAPTEVAIIGTSFDLRVERPEPYIGLAIVNKALGYESFSGLSAEVLLSKIVTMTNDGKTGRDFQRWLREQGISYDQRWADVLFNTVGHATTSNFHREQNLSVKDYLPYWELASITRFCRDHSRLDGLVRRWDDPVWDDIHPPNGWMCGCSVLACAPWDRKGAPHIRVTAQIRGRCKNWLDSDPTPALKLF